MTNYPIIFDDRFIVYYDLNIAPFDELFIFEDKRNKEKKRKKKEQQQEQNHFSKSRWGGKTFEFKNVSKNSNPFYDETMNLEWISRR